MNDAVQNTLPPRLVKVGDVLGGKYRVERILAEGTMATVARALDTSSAGTKVAIKVLHPLLRKNQEAFARFLEETRAVKALKSEHIAALVDVSADDPDTTFLVMELLDGVDLDAMVQLKGHVAPKVAADFIAQACTGVGVGHADGILHRGLKPANLFLARKPAGGALVKVLDFGLMKIKPDPTDSKRGPSEAPPSYTSPEQLAGESLDERTDIWSLGAILYELITGRSAFGAETVAQTLVNVTIHHPPKMSTFTPDVPEGLEDVVTKCLEKDREDRYATTAELALALVPFAGTVDAVEAVALLPDRAVSIAPPPPAPMIVDAPELSTTVRLGPRGRAADRTMRTIDDGEPEKPKTQRTVFVAIAIGAVFGGILALIFSQSSGGPRPDKTLPSSTPLTSSEMVPSATPSSREVPRVNVNDLPIVPSGATAPASNAPPHLEPPPQLPPSSATTATPPPASTTTTTTAIPTTTASPTPNLTATPTSGTTATATATPTVTAPPTATATTASPAPPVAPAKVVAPASSPAQAPPPPEGWVVP